MLIVMALQLFCYSVVQLMVVDQLLFHVLKENYFSKVRYDFINGAMAYQLVSSIHQCQLVYQYALKVNSSIKVRFKFGILSY